MESLSAPNIKSFRSSLSFLIKQISKMLKKPVPQLSFASIYFFFSCMCIPVCSGNIWIYITEQALSSLYDVRVNLYY